MDDKRKPVQLERDVAIGLLTRAEYGRVAFVRDGSPTIRPLNHVFFEGQLVLNTRKDSAFARAVREHPGMDVAFQADEINRHGRIGWSVLVTGTAADISELPGADRLANRVQSWIERPLDAVIVVEPRQVTGLHLSIEP